MDRIGEQARVGVENEGRRGVPGAPADRQHAKPGRDRGLGVRVGVSQGGSKTLMLVLGYDKIRQRVLTDEELRRIRKPPART
jgi:hypothetical protein